MSAGDIRAEVTGTDSTHNVHFNWTGRSGTGYFTPSETGLHKVRDTTRDCNLSFSPFSFIWLALVLFALLELPNILHQIPNIQDSPPYSITWTSVFGCFWLLSSLAAITSSKFPMQGIWRVFDDGKFCRDVLSEMQLQSKLDRIRFSFWSCAWKDLWSPWSNGIPCSFKSSSLKLYKAHPLNILIKP